MNDKSDIRERAIDTSQCAAKACLENRSAFGVLLILCFIFCGCSSTSHYAQPITAYNTAVTNATVVVDSVLISIAALDQKAASTTYFITNQPITELKESKLAAFFRPEDLMQRELAVQALCTYTAKLKELSGAASTGSISNSLNSAGNAINDMAININQLGGGSPNAIPNGVVSGLVSLAGNLVNHYVAGKRDKALKEIMEANNTTVLNVCDLLASEMDSKAGLIYDHVKYDYQLLEQDSEAKFKAAKESDKPSLVSAYVDELHDKTYTLGLIQNLATLYRQIGQSHLAVLTKIKNNQDPNPALNRLANDLALVQFYNTQLANKSALTK